MKIGDLLAVGMLLLAVWIILFILEIKNQPINLIGLTGGIITIIVEAVFLWNIWLKK